MAATTRAARASPVLYSRRRRAPRATGAIAARAQLLLADGAQHLVGLRLIAQTTRARWRRWWWRPGTASSATSALAMAAAGSVCSTGRHPSCGIRSHELQVPLRADVMRLEQQRLAIGPLGVRQVRFTIRAVGTRLAQRRAGPNCRGARNRSSGSSDAAACVERGARQGRIAGARARLCRYCTTRCRRLRCSLELRPDMLPPRAAHVTLIPCLLRIAERRCASRRGAAHNGERRRARPMRRVNDLGARAQSPRAAAGIQARGRPRCVRLSVAVARLYERHQVAHRAGLVRQAPAATIVPLRRIGDDAQYVVAAQRLRSARRSHPAARRRSVPRSSRTGNLDRLAPAFRNQNQMNAESRSGVALPAASVSSESCASPSVNSTTTRSAISGLAWSRSMPCAMRRRERRSALRGDVGIAAHRGTASTPSRRPKAARGCNSCRRTRRARSRSPSRSCTSRRASRIARPRRLGFASSASIEREISIAITRLRPRVSVTIRSSPQRGPDNRDCRQAGATVPPRACQTDRWRGRCAAVASGPGSGLAHTRPRRAHAAAPQTATPMTGASATTTGASKVIMARAPRRCRR